MPPKGSVSQLSHTCDICGSRRKLRWYYRTAQTLCGHCRRADQEKLLRKAAA